MRFALWLDFNYLILLYEPKRFLISKLNTSYFPDFYVFNTDQFFEVKGYFYDKAKQKFECFIKEYPNIKIQLVYKNNLDFLDKIMGIERNEL